MKRLDKLREEGKREVDQRHQVEVENLKKKYFTKLEIEKERVREENNRLLEESGDIDYQVRLFKSDLMESQYDQQKHNIDQEQRNLLRAH